MTRTAALLLWLAGCAGLPSYQCHSQADCEAAGPGARCEEDGWCSRADPTCASERRYVAEAGGGLSGQCVAEHVADAPPDDARAPSDAPGGDADTIGFGPATRLAILGSTGYDGGPTVTGDGLELYFHSDRGGSGFDIYRSTSSGNGWSEPELVTELNGPGSGDTHPDVAADGLSLWLTSDRAGTFDIYVSTRVARSDPWGAPQPLGEVNSASVDFGFSVASSGLTAALVSDRNAPDLDLFVTTRPTLAAAWQLPERLVELDSGLNEYPPFISEDGQEIVFPAIITGGLGGTDLYVARRLSPTESFGTPEPIAELNTSFHDGEPWLTQDGLTIYFASNRDGDIDVYVAER